VKRLALITLILGSAFSIVPVAGAVVLLDGSRDGGVSTAVPAPTMDPAIQAVLLRNEGLATQAVILRSKGLSNYYGQNAVSFHTDTLGGKANPVSAPVDTGNGFGWSNALAVTLGGMLLLGLAATTITRRRHRLLSY
jgi:hypothetical protein